MLDRVEAIARSVRKPLIADGDTGYGGLLNVHHTVRGYEKAGRGGHSTGGPAIPEEVRTHAEPSRDPGGGDGGQDQGRLRRPVFRRFPHPGPNRRASSLGVDEAIRRGEAYARAGADIIFIESPETVEQVRKIGWALDVPLLSNQLHGGRTPILPRAQLKEMGYSVAIYATAGLLAASHAAGERLRGTRAGRAGKGAVVRLRRLPRDDRLARGLDL